MLYLEAMGEGRLSAVNDLIQEGADVNAADPSAGGVRPLHLAVDIECEDACRRNDEGDPNAVPVASLSRILLVAGADPHLTNENGETAIDWARNRNHAWALALFHAA
jgi:ankyrin repeat protein